MSLNDTLTRQVICTSVWSRKFSSSRSLVGNQHSFKFRDILLNQHQPPQEEHRMLVLLVSSRPSASLPAYPMAPDLHQSEIRNHLRGIRKTRLGPSSSCHLTLIHSWMKLSSCDGTIKDPVSQISIMEPESGKRLLNVP